MGSAEIFARIVLGLGTPPLSLMHPTIEYMFRPNQDVMRFGNRQLYNQWGMRSAPLPDEEDSQIILVLGDSVLNGGSLTDQADLATTIATIEDADRFYANISAGSWGPANQLAYLQEFGTFNADAAILVLNAGDLHDLGQFEPIDPSTHPLENPLTALGEAITHYLPRHLPSGISDWLRPNPIKHPYAHPTIIMSGEDYLVSLFALFSDTKIPTCIIWHEGIEEQPELAGARIRKLAAIYGIPIVETLTVFSRNGRNPREFYRDNIHINSAGQSLLVDLLRSCVNLASVPSPIKRNEFRHLFHKP